MQLQQLKTALLHVTHVDYAFIRFNFDKNGNTLLNITSEDIKNLNSIKLANSKVPIIISVGGWGARDAFGFLSSDYKRKVFITSVLKSLYQLRASGLNIQGIDVDWENEELAPLSEITGLSDLFIELRKAFGNNFLITNAVPATPFYWIHYPDAKKWAPSVDWTTVMAYDHYGTFGPTAEFSSSLYNAKAGLPSANDYPYGQTSANFSINHYVKQGLKPSQILMGIPFYCHSYYVSEASGEHAAVIDPNISSQIDYQTALKLYNQKLFDYNVLEEEQNFSAYAFYGLINVDVAGKKVYRFINCENPITVQGKMQYVNGNNPMHQGFAGVSFWSLFQDVDYNKKSSLLRAINSDLN